MPPTVAPGYPVAVEAVYARALRRRVGLLAALVRAALAHLDDADSGDRADAPGGRLGAGNSGLASPGSTWSASTARREVERARTAVPPPAPAELRRVAEAVDRYTTGQVAGTLRTRAEVVLEAARQRGANPDPIELRRAWIADNVAKIRSFDARYFDAVAAAIDEAHAAGEPTKALGSRIAAITGTTRRRADLLARDQIGSLSSDITVKRATDLGLKQIRWRTSKDERVRGNPHGKYPKARPSHYAREGKVYDIASPPAEDPTDGLPGKPPLCRCTGEIVFPRPGRPVRGGPASGPDGTAHDDAAGLLAFIDGL